MPGKTFPEKAPPTSPEVSGLSAQSLKRVGLITALAGVATGLGWALAIPLWRHGFPGLEVDQLLFLVLSTGTLCGMAVLVLGLLRLNREADTAHHNRERFRLLVEGVQDYAIFMLTPEGRVGSWNSGAQRIKGYSAEEIIGEHFSRFYPAVDIGNGTPQQELKTAAETGRLEAEGIRVRKDGSRFWAHVTITALHDENGALRGFSKITRDITARKKNEEAVCAAHDRAISELLETISDGFVAYDRNWRYVRVNSAALKLLHKSADELLGKVLWDVFPEAERLRFGIEYHRAVAENVPVKFEDFYPQPLNRWFEVRCHPSVEGLNVLFIDITERKATEQRLRQLSRAVEQSPSSVMITDTNGRIEYVNPKFTEITGYGFEETIGQTPRMLKSGKHPPEFYKEIWETIKAGHEWRGELQNKRKNGEIYWVATSICPITDDTGAISRFLSIKEDITDRKNAQTALLEAKQSAEQANKAKDVFLATLSHELRTPLTPVLLTASSLENDTTLDPELHSQFSLIRNNIELEARLIDDLLDITKIVHGKFSVRCEDIDAGEVLSTVLDTVRGEYLAKNITIQRDGAAHSMAVHADPARLQQVFWNLLKNAIKFTPAGGDIYVRTFNPDPLTLSIEIRDTGIGIAPNFLRVVFDPFQQGDVTGNQQFGGLGLGLAISKTIVEVHRGTILAASDGLNAGTTFTVQLPLSEGVGSARIAPALAAPPQPRRILLVEDHESTREVLARLLRKDGHRVEAVGSCADALKAAYSQPASEPFQVLVCDLGLPDGSGMDIVRELKVAIPGLATVALSGFGTDDDILRSRAAGFSEHLVKPASIQELRRALLAA